MDDWLEAAYEERYEDDLMAFREKELDEDAAAGEFDDLVSPPLVELVNTSTGEIVGSLDVPSTDFDVIDVNAGHDGYMSVRLVFGTQGLIAIRLIDEATATPFTVWNR